MEFVIVVVGVAALVAAYFCLGIFLKFMIGWWLLVLGIPALLACVILLGWLGAAIGLVGCFVLLAVSNRWQGCELYLALERKIDKAFYLADT